MTGRGISVGVAVDGMDVSVTVASGYGVAVSDGVVGERVAVRGGIALESWHPLRMRRVANPHKKAFFTQGTLFL